MNEQLIDGGIIKVKKREQLGIFLLDGSGSMDDIGEMNNSLAENVGRVFKDFVVTRFMTSSISEEFQIAVINFDYEAIVRVPRIPLSAFEEFADYNPRDISKDNPGTNIGAGLQEAKKIIGDFFAQPNPDGYPRTVVIAILSDGMCQRPESTLAIARELDANPDITISCGLFTTKEREAAYINKEAKNFLQDIKSRAGIYGVIENNETLRKFFNASMSVNKEKENQKK